MNNSRRRVFVYEFVSGGGTWSCDPPHPPSGSLLDEGVAMVRALAADFLRLPDTEVAVLRDSRLPHLQIPGCAVDEVRSADDELDRLTRRAAESDWTVLIAPEFDALLHKRCQLAQAAGGRLLSPDADFAALATDKTRTADWLSSAGIRVPCGRRLDDKSLPVDFDYPAILKPNDGAGSVGVFRLESAEDPVPRHHGCLRLERFCPGTPASVAMLSGPSETKTLAPCAQRVSNDGRYRYLGGNLPLDRQLAERAVALAHTVARSLPRTRGYWGMDLVLGHEGPMSDVVVEVNPRLTTSYLGLRRATHQNLAEAMMAVAEGHDFELSFRSERVEFAAGADRSPV